MPGTGPDPQTPPSESKTPHVAVASLIFGLIAFFTMLFFVGTFPAVIAVITGHVAINRIQHSRDRYGGYGIAMAGVVLGYITLIGTSVLMLLVLFSYHPVSRYLDQHRQKQSMRNASHLYLASEAYARDHKDVYPEKWQDLEGRYINTHDLASCLHSVYTLPFRESGSPAFRIVSHQRPILPAIISQVVVIQENAPPDVDLITAVYADGNTELIANPERNLDP